jgi:hypothetical protein
MRWPERWSSDWPRTSGGNLPMSNIVLVLELIISFECMPPVPMTERDTRRDRATALNLHGLLAHWGEIAGETWITSLLG